jgi:hypothetical protein
VQGVAERILATKPDFSTPADLLPWCVVVARNLDADLRRRSIRFGDADVLVDAHSQECVEETVVARLRLQRTISALTTLSARDRQLIVDDVTVGGSLVGRDRVAKHRARGRLLRLVGPAAIVPAIGRYLRSLGRTATGATALCLASAGAFLGLAVTIDVTRGTDLATPALLNAESTSRTLTPTASHLNGSLPPISRTQTARAARVDVQEAKADFVVQTPDRRKTLTVAGHDRRGGDQGLVCVDDLPGLAHACFGPSHVPNPPTPVETFVEHGTLQVGSH